MSAVVCTCTIEAELAFTVPPVTDAAGIDVQPVVLQASVASWPCDALGHAHVDSAREAKVTPDGIVHGNNSRFAFEPALTPLMPHSGRFVLPRRLITSRSLSRSVALTVLMVKLPSLTTCVSEKTK